MVNEVKEKTQKTIETQQPPTSEVGFIAITIDKRTGITRLSLDNLRPEEALAAAEALYHNLVRAVARAEAAQSLQGEEPATNKKKR